MTRKLSLGPLPKAEPVKLTLTITTRLREDLERYAALHQELHGVPVDITTIAPLMLETFLARDKGFRAACSNRTPRRKQTAEKAAGPTAPASDRGPEPKPLFFVPPSTGA